MIDTLNQTGWTATLPLNSKAKGLYTPLYSMYYMVTIKDDRMNIKLSRKTYNQLKKLGLFGETYEDIIKRLLEIKEEEKH